MSFAVSSANSSMPSDARKIGSVSGSFARRLSSTFLRDDHAAALELGDVLELQLVEIGRLADELRLDELRDELVAPLVDVLHADPALDAALDERAALEVRAHEVLALARERLVARRALRRDLGVSCRA